MISIAGESATYLEGAYPPSHQPKSQGLDSSVTTSTIQIFRSLTFIGQEGAHRHLLSLVFGSYTTLSGQRLLVNIRADSIGKKVKKGLERTHDCGEVGETRQQISARFSRERGKKNSKKVNDTWSG